MDNQRKLELRGCVCRITSCAYELSSVEEDPATYMDDYDSWGLVERDVQLKAVFLRIDLTRVIARSEGAERRKELTFLANEVFYYMEELGYAVMSRSPAPVVKKCFGDAIQAIREVIAAITKPAAV